jgi:uncharacterized protein (TIGR02246 family)
MTNRFLRLQFAALIVLLAGLAPAWDGGKHPAEIQAIRDNEVRWSHEFEAKDLEKVLAHYADDAVMMAPGFPAFTGKEAIRSALQAMLADAAMSLKFQTSRIEIGDSGDMASSWGSYTATMTDPATKKSVTSGGSYVTVYRKQGGQWKAVFDIASAGPSAQ